MGDLSNRARAKAHACGKVGGNVIFSHVVADKAYLRKTIAFLDSMPMDEPKNGYPTSHEITLEWEKKARLWYHGALTYRLCKAMGFTDPALDVFRSRAIKTLGEWTAWRPTSTDGSFDANNWANGYLPGAWGLLGGDVDTFHRQGTSFTERLPPAAHWMKRSTNHGIVIFVTYLMGAIALGARPVGRDVLEDVVRRSLGGGCYLEGINYLTFVMSEVIPYLHATWDGNGDFGTHARTLLPGVEGAKEMYLWSAGRQGLVRATFADGAKLKLYRHNTNVLDSLTSEGSVRKKLGSETFRDDWRLAPFDIAYSCKNSPPQLDRIFDEQIGVYQDDDVALWMIGSRLHLTHNAAHDCGTFFFERDDLFVGEQPGREAFRHNVPLLRDAPGFPNCVGPDPFVKRRSHGRLERLGPRSWRMTSARAFQGCPSEIVAHVRDLHLVDNCLVVLDRVLVEGPGEPVIQFHTHALTSLDGVTTHEERSLVRMRQVDREWVSAAVVGAKDRLRLDRGVVFRNTCLPFPAVIRMHQSAKPRRKIRSIRHVL